MWMAIPVAMSVVSPGLTESGSSMHARKSSPADPDVA